MFVYQVHKFAGSSTKWLDLPWSFQLRRLSTITLLAATRELAFGKFRISTRDIYEITPDESGYTLAEGRIIDETGAINGGVKLVLRIDPMEFHADEDAFSSLEVDGAVYQSCPPYDLPASLLVDRIFVSGLPRLHVFSANAPHVEIQCGALVNKTDPVHCKGTSSAAAKAEWYELGWHMNLRSELHAFNVIVRSGGVLAGSLSFAVNDIVALPRTSRGYIKIEGPLIDGSKLVGRVCVMAKLNRYRPQFDEAGSAAELTSAVVVDDDGEATDSAEGCAVLAQIVFLSVAASDMRQRIGLYRHSPQVYMTVASEEYTSSVSCI
jgi:hypothetical protein